ncbi:MAG: transposase [Candidatus Aenigmarchaeota archaeon]|nr:transposase [Candidatus Aenigmarchaeota archaeon]
MKLKGIKFQTQLIKHLESNRQDAINLGAISEQKGKKMLPSRRTFNYFMQERLTKEIWGIIDFAVERIKETAIKRGMLLDFAVIEEKQKRSSKRTFFRKKQRKLRETCKLMRKAIYPMVNLDIAHNSVYKKSDFLDLITHVALTHDFTENGSATFNLTKKGPNGDTLLYHIKKYRHRMPMEEMFKRVFDMTFEMAKKSGFLNRPMELAIDYTDILYYGDSHDYMVLGTKPQKGTCYAYKFAVVSIVTNGERFILYALPVSPETKKVQVVRDLIEYAKSKVRIKRVYMDRGFFGGEVIDFLNRKRIEFIMPATRSWRIKRIMDERGAPYVTDYKMRNEWLKYTTWFKLAIVKSSKDSKKYAFATNMDITENNSFLLFDYYDRRWGVETAFRVKESFRARTTSKNYIIRLFYFMFSTVLYNLWVIVNAMLCMFLFGSLRDKPIVTAKIVGTLLYMIEGGIP